MPPIVPAAARFYAQLLWCVGEHEQADAVLQDAQVAQPAPSAPLESALSLHYAATARPAEAIRHAAKAVELNPDDATTAYHHAMTLATSGERTKGLAAAQKMTTRFPREPLAWDALANAAMAAQDAQAAREAFRGWLELQPQSPRALAAYGNFLLRTGQASEARKLLEKAVREIPGDGILWLAYADVLAALGETTAAEAAKAKGLPLLTPAQQALIKR
jgi:predicted Zn-dependent protease